MEKYNKYPPACVIAFVCLDFLIKNDFWKKIRYKRPITRLFYMLCGSIKSGYMSNKTIGLKVIKKCADHIFCPQMMCYFICDMWKKFNTIEKFYEIWTVCSTTVDLTSKENKALSGFSHNNESTGNVLKVSESITKRYKRLDIKLWHKEYGANCDFPFHKYLDEDFNNYEEKNLMIEK